MTTTSWSLEKKTPPTSERASLVDDVTLLATASVDQLSQTSHVAELAKAWRGAMTLVVCVRYATRSADVGFVERFVAQHDSVRRFVDLHLLETSGHACSYAAALNVALEHMHTLHRRHNASDDANDDWVLPLHDVGMHWIGPVGNAGAHAVLVDAARRALAAENNNDNDNDNDRNTAFVIAAFESTATNVAQLPSTKRELVERARLGLITTRDEFDCLPCQSPINIDRWYG